MDEAVQACNDKVQQPRHSNVSRRTMPLNTRTRVWCDKLRIYVALAITCPTVVSPSRNVIGVGNTQSLLGVCARTWGHKQELPWKSTFQVETDTLIYEETLRRLSAAQITKQNIRAMHSLVSMTEQVLEESYYPIRRNFEPKYEIRLNILHRREQESTARRSVFVRNEWV